MADKSPLDATAGVGLAVGAGGAAILGLSAITGADGLFGQLVNAVGTLAAVGGSGVGTGALFLRVREIDARTRSLDLATTALVGAATVSLASFLAALAYGTRGVLGAEIVFALAGAVACGGLAGGAVAAARAAERADAEALGISPAQVRKRARAGYGPEMARLKREREEREARTESRSVEEVLASGGNAGEAKDSTPLPIKILKFIVRE